jgi:hypothetical protein
METLKKAPHPGKKPEDLKNRRTGKCGERISVDILHYDLPCDGYKFALVIVDHATRTTYVYSMTNKGECVIDALEMWYEKSIAQGNVRLKSIRCDNESIIIGKRGNEWFKKKGITLEPTQAYTSQQNGIAEATNRQLRRITNAILTTSQLPQDVFYVYAFEQAVFLNNILPKSTLGGDTPNEARLKESYDYEKLIPFGALMFRKNMKQRSKNTLKGESEKFICIGNYHGDHHSLKGYNIKTGKVQKVHGATIFELQPKVTDWFQQLEYGNVPVETLFEVPTTEEEITSPSSKQIKTQVTESILEGVTRKSKHIPKKLFDDDSDDSENSVTIEGVMRVENNVQNQGVSSESENDTEIEDDTMNEEEDEKQNTSESEYEYETANEVEVPRTLKPRVRRKPERLIEGMQTDKRPLPSNIYRAKTYNQKFKAMFHAWKQDYTTDGFWSASMAHIAVMRAGTRHRSLIRSKYPRANEIETPKNEKEANAGLYADEWKIAREIELENLMAHGTFEIEKKSKSQRQLGVKFVYAVKADEKGQVIQFKARLVARGFEMIHMLHYTETFAPVARDTTIKWLLAWGAKKGMEFYQVDYHGAFLHSKIPERHSIYIKTPDGINIGEDEVLRCIKGLYGTKNAGHLWIKDLDKSLQEIGFKRSRADQSLYTYKRHGKILCACVVWVDDLIFASQDDKLWEQILSKIGKQGFTLSSVESLQFFLGMKIEFKENGVVKISQRSYIEDVLKRFGFERANGVKTPIKPEDTMKHIEMPEKGTSQHFEENDGCEFEVRQAVGALYHLARWTMPEILFAVNHCAQFQTLSKKQTWKRVENIMKYVANNKDCYQEFGNKETPMVMFVDSGYGGTARENALKAAAKRRGRVLSADKIEKMSELEMKRVLNSILEEQTKSSNGIDFHKEDLKSQYGYVCMFFGGPGSCSSKKDPALSQSSTEAEIKALNESIREALHLIKLLNEFGMSPNYQVQQENDPMIILEDNAGAKSTANSEKTTQRNKHLAIKQFWCAEQVENGHVRVMTVTTHENVADIFTKPFAAPQFEKLALWLRGKAWPPSYETGEGSFD